MNPLFLFDQEHRERYGRIAGVDEAGRGPLAGPLVASAVILPPDFHHPLLNDSKKLTDRRRRELFSVVNEEAEAFATGVVTPREIDANRMAWAVRTAFRRAMEPLAKKCDLFLVDGNGVPGLGHPSLFLVKGDSRSLSVAAASIIAKVTRDDMMMEAAGKHPGYSFDRHKGYGTAAHLKALKDLGPSPLHRMSFEPLASRYETGQLSLFPGVQNPGGAGEGAVARHLAKLGYEVLERNWRCPGGEIDIIARKGDRVFFIEVKSSFSGDGRTQLEKLSFTGTERIRSAAAAWMDAKGCREEVLLMCALLTNGGVELLPMD
ncbi:MAG TPA: ribonuclease HII [Candidatus Sabulitectum sp.]|nr:ribonuclease HII [Candidatus Sabulitectum sp.]